ncbi:MAG: TetR/AcrR family transcriptional regulator [Gammaproteobacteria bacterium]|nr:TetR/AcrR family transcriptional regulator [Gammaproteobacteria bacterium]
MQASRARRGAAPPRRQRERTELSDRRMRDAAVRLLVERGVAGATLAEIGRRAGYSRGLATHRYGSKAGLLRAVLQSISRRWRETLALHTSGKWGVEAMCGAVDAQLAMLREHPAEVRAMFLLWFVSIDPGAKFRLNVRRVHDTQRRDVAAWVEQALARSAIAADADPARIAEQFCAAMIGIVYQWLVGEDMPLEAMHLKLKADIRRLHGTKRTANRGMTYARSIHL